MSLLIYILLCAVPPLLADGVSVDSTDTYFRLMGEADKAIADGEWSRAEEKLLEALRSQPGNPSNVLLMSNLGMVRYHAGRTDEAITTLTDAHYMAPTSVTVLQNRGRVYAETGRTEEACADYAAVMRLDSTLVEPAFYHAMLSLELNRPDSTAADVERLRRIAPDDRLTDLAEATLHISLGDYAGAIPAYVRLINKEKQAGYYAARALCYLMTQQLGEAAADIASGLELDPADGDLYLYRAMLNKMRFRLEDAKADAERAVSLGVKKSVADSVIY